MIKGTRLYAVVVQRWQNRNEIAIKLRLKPLLKPTQWEQKSAVIYNPAIR